MGNYATSASARSAENIVLRRTEMADTDALFAWRNDPLTRRNSRITDLVPREDHDRWFARMLARSEGRLYIGEVSGERAGVVRFDVIGACVFEVSITVAPSLRSRGHGRRLLGIALKTMAPCVLIAEIKDENVASKRLFTSCGFQLIGYSEDHLNRYALILPAGQLAP